MEIRELAICPGCGASGATTVRLGSEHELRRCTTCELVYAAEYGDPDEIYVEGYLTGGTEFGIDVSHPRFQEFLAYAAGKRLDVIEAHAPAGGRLLDLGCGSGEVLAVAQARGWEVAGAEPVEESAAVARARGVDVRTGLVQHTDLPRGAWDVVTAFHVLEHLTDGRAFLQLAASYAKPGGLVVIETPNWRSEERRRKGAAWPAVRPLEHVAHYDPLTMRRAFVAAGLTPVLVRTMGFLWEQQSLHERLSDLGRDRWARVLHRVARPRLRDGNAIVVPGPAVSAGLLAVQAGFDRLGRGQVVLGLARPGPTS